jgi:chemotaxis protein MotB
MKGRRFKDNWALSGERATVFVRMLEKNGVPGNRLSAAGFSQYQSVASNRTKAGKALNRRIEITLLPSIPGQVNE